MSATGRTDEAGFTLLEMLVVLAILGLVSGLAFPAVERAVAQQRFRLALAEVDSALREARSLAIATGSPRTFAPPVLDRSLALTLPRSGMVFHPDGSASGGEIALEGEGRSHRIAVDAATGRIAGQR